MSTDVVENVPKIAGFLDSDRRELVKQLRIGIRQGRLPRSTIRRYRHDPTFRAAVEAKILDRVNQENAAMASGTGSGGGSGAGSGSGSGAPGGIKQKLLNLAQWLIKNLPAIIAIFTSIFGGATGAAVGILEDGGVGFRDVPHVECLPYVKWPAPDHMRALDAVSWYVADLCEAYGLKAGTFPGGGKISITELGGGWDQSDLDAFSAANRGMPMIVVQDVSVDGTTNSYMQDPNADGEVALDIQVAAAVYYHLTGKMTDISVFWARDIAPAVRAAALAGYDVNSISWGADEKRWAQQPGSAEDMEQAAADATKAGMAVLAASGDNSSGDGDWGSNVDLPAACPHVIACGGTTKTDADEIVWGQRFRFDGAGGGGGYSRIFPAQSWQVGAPQGTRYGRMVPDIAAVADPNTGYRIVVHGQETVIGGTSAVAPFWAGVIAALGPKPGYLLPSMYTNPQDFTDITQGSNGRWVAGPGVDPCTGLGVPSSKVLVMRQPAEAMAGPTMGGLARRPLSAADRGALREKLRGELKAANAFKAESVMDFIPPAASAAVEQYLAELIAREVQVMVPKLSQAILDFVREKFGTGDPGKNAGQSSS